MACVLTPATAIPVRHQVNRLSVNFTLTYTSSQFYQTTTVRKCRCNGQFLTTKAKMSVEGGLEINEARPHDKLPYRGAWLWVGAEMIHLMELPNPDPLSGRPEHGGRDRHTCIAIRDVSKLKMILDKAGISYTLSKSGRPAIFTRDPDANALEFTQVDG
ncbi:VOC domain-containing protein [Citrus sinensis]|uniref:VOC domain-containing protein n=1 Tax=Citrus sinensis TaxID=2711 RepID=A0ACB8NVY7_CITSI|nr:VOC domain-containing protein [Citrus sinensis]